MTKTFNKMSVPPDRRRKYSAFLFDFDGTVIDTNSLVINSFQHTFLELTGHAGDPAEILPTFGEKLDDILLKFFPDVPVEKSLAIYREYQTGHASGDSSLFPGIIEAVDKLRSAGVRTALVTSRHSLTTRVYVERFNLAERFPVIITEESTKAHKPDPAPVLKALNDLDASADEAVMVGDSRNDMLCAKNAGVDFALVGWSLSMDASEYCNANAGEGPDMVIKKPADLIDLADI